MRIGIDFDNTIARYDHVFPIVAEAEGILVVGTTRGKSDVRDILRARGPDGELLWQRLQGMVYGKHMQSAAMFDGVGDFLEICRARSIPVCIVSHKTKTGHHDPERINLRDAALNWMDDNGFFKAETFAIPRDRVFFEDTRVAKIERIRALNLSHFIDDLCEVLEDPAFPSDVERLHFGADCGGNAAHTVKSFGTWPEITAHLL